MPTILTNGITTYYEEDPGPPDGNGEPLVLLHGFTGSLALWAEARPMLAATHRVIAYDLRGHGRSDAPVDIDSYTIDGYVEDLHALLDALGVDRTHLLGSGFGGMIALEFALRFPTRLRSLILADTTAGPRCIELSEPLAAREDGIARALAYVREHGFDTHVESILDINPALRGDPNRPEHFDAGWERMTVHGFLGAGKARMERPDRHLDLEQLTLPVLIIAGDRDVQLPAAEYMHAHIPHSALRLINHAQDPAVADQPHGFVAMVRGFLAGLDPEHQRRRPSPSQHTGS